MGWKQGPEESSCAVLQLRIGSEQVPMLPFQLSGELGDFLPHLAGQRWPGTLASALACRLPLLPVHLCSLDLSVEFGEAW